MTLALENIQSIYLCKYCETGNDKGDDFGADKNELGFWCDFCDGYNFFDPKNDSRKYILFMEDKSSSNQSVSPSRIKFNKRLSPMRFPGGKSKFINPIYSKLNLGKTKTFVEPFAGGASVGLSLLHARVIENLIINDIDFGIYSLFWVIKHAPHELIERIKYCNPSHKSFFHAQSIVRSDYMGCNIFESAWATLLVNRLAYSGIYYANPLGGKNGTRESLLQRWNPKDLIKRIETIHSMSDQITVYNIDACELIEEVYWLPNTTIFIDPPYVQKGKQLYRCYYENEDHYKLELLLDSLYKEFPGADLIITYDNDPLINQSYFHPEVEIVSRFYSI